MIKLHASRLMRGGEVALWHGGRMVWGGSVGDAIDGIAFDAMSPSIGDGARMLPARSPQTWRATHCAPGAE